MESYFSFSHFSALLVRSFTITGVSSEMQELQEDLSLTKKALKEAEERRKALEEDLKKAASQEEKSTIQATLVEACKEVAAYVNLLTELRQDLRDLKSKTPNAPGLSGVVFCCVSPPVRLCC